jgi:hypothetical protein
VQVQAPTPRVIDLDLETKFRSELQGLQGNPDTFFFDGIENFFISGLSEAAALEILVKLPQVYRGNFKWLDPDYNRKPATREFREAVVGVEEAAADFGTGIPERADKLRAQIIDTPEKLRALVKEWSAETALALDLETLPTPGVNFNVTRDLGDTRKSEVRLITLATRDGRTALIDAWALGRQTVSTELKPWLERVLVIAHNLQYDWAFLLDHYGIELGAELFDTLLAARVLSNEAPLVV